MRLKGAEEVPGKCLSAAQDALSVSAVAKRYPTHGSLMRYRGCEGSGSILRRSCATNVHQRVSHPNPTAY